MLHAALLIWIGLLGYRTYDCIYIQNAPKPPPPVQQVKKDDSPARPVFNPAWDGHGAKKIKAKKTAKRMGKAVPIAQKAKQANSR